MTYIRKPVAPPADVVYAHKNGRGMLLPEQIQELVKAINPAFVETKQKLTYLAQHQARAEMNRIFGYGNWSVDAGDPTLLYEYTQKGSGTNANKDYWLVAYRIRVTVAIRDLWGMPVAEFTGVHAEENAPQPNRGEAHALALTSVDSYALRRALINLGDRFGLGLYNGGSKAPHGLYTIQLQPGILSTWEQGVPAAVAAMPTHETAPFEQAVPEVGEPSDYDDAESDGRGGVRSKTQQRFAAVREQVQANNAAARLQAGLHVDNTFDGPGVGDA